MLALLNKFDLFSEKLDDLLVQTRCTTREEMMHELREKRSIGEILRRLEELQKADIQAPSSIQPFDALVTLE